MNLVFEIPRFNRNDNGDMKIEICASNFESARIAQECGADRIELCTDLGVGGITPTSDIIRKVISELSIPVHVLVRPRKGDFVYSDSELSDMLHTIGFCYDIECAGIVSGVLTSTDEIDLKHTAKLIDASKSMEFTFHRAFDSVRDPISGLNALIDLGVNRLLSSGQELVASEGISLLTRLNQQANDRIEIMPGAGINEVNAHLFKDAGFQCIHLSAIKKNASVSTLFETGITGVSDPETIKKVLAVVR